MAHVANAPMGRENYNIATLMKTEKEIMNTSFELNFSASFG